MKIYRWWACFKLLICNYNMFSVDLFASLFPDVIIPPNDPQNDCYKSHLIIICVSVAAFVILIISECVTVDKFSTFSNFRSQYLMFE